MKIKEIPASELKVLEHPCPLIVEYGGKQFIRLRDSNLISLEEVARIPGTFECRLPRDIVGRNSCTLNTFVCID